MNFFVEIKSNQDHTAPKLNLYMFKICFLIAMPGFSVYLTDLMHPRLGKLKSSLQVIFTLFKPSR